MKRRLIPITRRLFSTNPAEPQSNLPKKEPEFDVFDYAGHKFSYEHRKNYGQYDVQQLWGDRVIYANDKETLKQKQKDNIVAVLIFLSFATCAYLKYEGETRLLESARHVLSEIDPKFGK